MVGRNYPTYDLSIIVPVAKNDQEWKNLIQDLSSLSSLWEVIFCGPKPFLALEDPYIRDFLERPTVSWLDKDLGRAGQLNYASKKAKGKNLWYLHADSRIDESCLKTIENYIPKIRNKIFFLRLVFKKDGPETITINQFGAYFRSQFLKIPFGDQGLCMEKSTWEKLQGYPEDVAHGEDHLFIWKARQNFFEIESLPAIIRSSARKYKKNGWGSTTWNHLKITWTQAFPEAKKLLLLLLKERIKTITKFYKPAKKI